MPDNRNNVEIAKTADAPPTYRNNYSQSNYIEAPNDGGKAYGSQARLTLWREWRSIIYRHRWLILSIVLVALSFAAIQACRVKPIYQATTTIDISPETSSLSKSGGVLVFGPGDNTKAEVVIIKSLPVLKKTVLSLNLDKNPSFLDVDAKRANPESLPSGSQSGGKKENASKDVASKNLASKDVKELVEKNLGQDAGDDESQPATSKNARSFADPADILTTARAERVRLAPYVQALLDNLKVEGVRETRLIRVSFTHTNPEIAAAVANGVANSFISHNFQTKTERFTNTSRWLEESTQKLKEQVEDSERKLANYSRQNNIFSLEGRENLTADKMVRLHDQAMRAETSRLLKQTLFEEVKNGNGAQLPESFADPKTAELRKTFNDLGVMASQLSVKFGPKHPKLVEIRQQMATLQEQIKENQSMLEERLKADYGRAVGEEKSLKAALMISKGEAVRQNQAAIQYSVLQQDLATAKSLYTDFLNKTSQANIQRAEQFNNVRLIEGAEPPESPIGPNRYLPIAFSLILSLALGIGLAYLMENLNTTLRTVEEVSRVTQLPMLAVIPTLKAPIPEAVLNRISPGMTFRRKWSQRLRAAGPIQILDSTEQPDDGSGAPAVDGSERMVWAASEAYRMLRTSILLSTAEHPPKTVLVTSGQPGD